MIEINPSRWKTSPWVHQTRGTRLLMQHPRFALFWKMRLGKSKAAIDAFCELADVGEVDTLLLLAPKQVVNVWTDKEVGEMKAHCWKEVVSIQYENSDYDLYVPDRPVLTFVAASLEFLRQEGPNPKVPFPLASELMRALEGRKVMMVLDEGSAIGKWDSGNTRASTFIAEKVDRAVLLDGTPFGNSPLTLYSKFKFLGKDILGCDNFFHFRGRYSVKGGFRGKQVVGYRNLDKLMKLTEPHCEYLEREPKGMPEKVYGFLPVAMPEDVWKVYKQMRDEYVAEWDGDIATVPNGAVKSMRLAQIASGFLGGFQDESMGISETRKLSEHVADAFKAWLETRLEEDKDFKCVVWSRWRAEIELVVAKISGITKLNRVGQCWGDRKDPNFLHPSWHGLKGSAVMVCQPQAVAYGVNMSKASAEIYLSSNYDRVLREQSEDRPIDSQRSRTVSVTDVVVTGPQGQKTAFHDIVASVKSKGELEKRSAQVWRKILSEE